MKDEIKFKQNMTAICELFDRDLSELLLGLYWKALEPFTDSQCERAFKQIILSSRFFPKPVDFIETIRGKEEDRAEKAWIKVVDAVRRNGNYESVQFEDRVIHSVIKFMGGWSKTGEWTEKELKWIEKEFVKLYGIMAGQPEHPSYLPGVFEIDNAARGYDHKAEPIRIGSNAPMPSELAYETATQTFKDHDDRIGGVQNG